MRFTRALLSWYAANKRDLPWRKTRDAYHVWLSEIILQQTRIDQGMPYYERFVRAYPTVSHLAGADEQEVLKHWQGLGYYSRARNMHAAARMIMQDHDGSFPESYDAIRKLKGVGDYTAAAIASICFDLPYAVVDGNVNRFLSRLAGITEPVDLPATRKRILAIATENLDPGRPGDYNQAMMEFGALVCTPVRPGCNTCPFSDSCEALRGELTDRIPAKSAKAAPRNRYLHYLVITVMQEDRLHLYMKKRTGSDIWKNMYDFPCVEKFPGHKPLQLEPGDLRDMDIFGIQEPTGGSKTSVHLLTHQKLHITFHRWHAEEASALPYMLVPVKDVREYPLPKPVDRYLSDTFVPYGG